MEEDLKELEKEFVTYEIGLKLKELGFNKSCFARVSESGITYPSCALNSKSTSIPRVYDHEFTGAYKSWVRAPLWQQVIGWVRDNYHYQIEVLSNYDTEIPNTFLYSFLILSLDGYYLKWEYTSDKQYKEYPEAREKGILKAIELIKDKK